MSYLENAEECLNGNDLKPETPSLTFPAEDDSSSSQLEEDQQSKEAIMIKQPSQLKRMLTLVLDVLREIADDPLPIVKAVSTLILIAQAACVIFTAIAVLD